MNKIPNKLLEIIRNQNFKGIQQINELLYENTFYKIQNLLQYHPQLWGIPKSPENNSIGFRNPAEHQLKYKNVYLETEDHEKLHCWLVLQESSDKRKQKISDQVVSKDNQMKDEVPTILYFHGNAKNMGFHMNQIKQFHQIGCNVFIVSYRGFGNSTGDPSYRGFQIDSETCLNYLLQCNEINSKHIIVYGLSLGGAVGIDLTYRKQHQIKSLIVENTFTSIADMCDYRFPFLSKVKDLMINNEWNSIKLIESIQNPTLFLVGEQDIKIPPSHSHQLYKRAINSKYKSIISNRKGHHGNTFNQIYNENREVLVDFIYRSS